MTVVDLHVREAGSGLPVVLLHAFPLSCAMWLEQRNDLGEVCRIITPDLRGFGGSQLGWDEPSLDQMADDVAALLGETTVAEHPMIQGRVRALVEDAPPPAAAWAQRAMAARPDSFDTLRGVTVPALVIAGAEDTLSLVSDAEAMVDALPDARLVVVPRCGHLTAVEAPDAFNVAVREFLASLG